MLLLPFLCVFAPLWRAFTTTIMRCHPPLLCVFTTAILWFTTFIMCFTPLLCAFTHAIMCPGDVWGPAKTMRGCSGSWESECSLHSAAPSSPNPKQEVAINCISLSMYRYIGIGRGSNCILRIEIEVFVILLYQCYLARFGLRMFVNFNHRKLSCGISPGPRQVSFLISIFFFNNHNQVSVCVTLFIFSTHYIWRFMLKQPIHMNEMLAMFTLYSVIQISRCRFFHAQ